MGRDLTGRWDHSSAENTRNPWSLPHSRRAIGDIEMPVQLHQGKGEFRIGLGGSSVTDGWRGRQGEMTETGAPFFSTQ